MARVLIADDASFMRQMIREIIEPEGYEVVGEATNGIEAVDLYKELQPDLVTMDIVMPKRSGIDAVNTILAENPAACVVMCSALGQETLVMEAIQAGARDFIVKPFKPDSVIATLKKVVEKAD
ncbi:MAG: response regulator [bacterium]|nr:response regulator [bacterium]